MVHYLSSPHHQHQRTDYSTTSFATLVEMKERLQRPNLSGPLSHFYPWLRGVSPPPSFQGDFHPLLLALASVLPTPPLVDICRLLCCEAYAVSDPFTVLICLSACPLTTTSVSCSETKNKKKEKETRKRKEENNSLSCLGPI